MDLVEILSFLFQLSFSTLGRVSAQLLVPSMLEAEWEGFGLCSCRIIQWRAWATHCWPSCSTYGSLDLSFRERWGIPRPTLEEPTHILHLRVRHCNTFPSEEVSALLSHQTGHHTSHRRLQQLPAHPHSQLGLNSWFWWLWLHRGRNKLPHLRLHQ